MNQNKKPLLEAAGRGYKIIIWILLLITAITLILIIWPPLYNAIHSYDIRALRAVNANRLKPLDPFFVFITNTSSIVCLLITGITILAALIKRSATLKLKGLQLLLTFLTSFIIIKCLKYLIGRDRPYVTYDFLDKLVHAESLSFPSGHTFEAFAFATAIVLQFRNHWYRSAIILWAILVGSSRMILGMHYLSDVIGGIIFGVLTSYFVHVLYRKNTMVTNA